MSELRQDITTKDWVIIAPERASRPQQEPVIKATPEVLPDWDANCPFCPGNEAKTPRETLKIASATEPASWEIRVIPNLFSALNPQGDTTRTEDGPFHRKMGGYGAHEVIIDSPSHNMPPALMPYSHVEKILKAFQARYNFLKADRRLKYITVFKNAGWAAGTSLVHPHSQLVATPIMPPYFHRKYDVAHDYQADMGKCLYCDLIKSELSTRSRRVVAATESFVVIHPYASHAAYETWVIPRQHHASFGLFPGEYMPDLATVLKDVLQCLYIGLDNPAYNLIIDSATTDDEENPYYHWHIRIIPRLSTIAGFEMGSGIYISTALPEETAEFMRNVACTCPEDVCASLRSPL